MSVPELDIVFLMDCTGSMAGEINAAKENIYTISQRLLASEQRDIRFAFVAYKDHHAGDEFAVKSFDFTDSLKTMKSHVASMVASGGADGPESVADALEATLHLSFRKNSTKVAVLIADAPPHGIGGAGDSFPNGCPCGFDPLKIARELSKREIVLYALGVEPNLSSYHSAAAFFSALARITGGQFYSLGKASTKLIPELIIGAAEEEIQLERLAGDVEAAINEARAIAEKNKETVDEDELAERANCILQSKGINVQQMEVDMQYEAPKHYTDAYCSATSLEEARKKVPGAEAGGSYYSAPMAYRASAATSKKKKRSGSFFSGFTGFFSGSSSKPASSGSSDAEEDLEEEECFDAPVSAPPSYDYACQSVAHVSKATSSAQVKRLATRKGYF